MQLSALRSLLGQDYTETYYSPRGEEITTSPQNMVNGIFLGSDTYTIRYIGPRATLKNFKKLKARCSSMTDEKTDEKKLVSFL